MSDDNNPVSSDIESSRKLPRIIWRIMAFVFSVAIVAFFLRPEQEDPPQPVVAEKLIDVAAEEPIDEELADKMRAIKRKDREKLFKVFGEDLRIQIDLWGLLRDPSYPEEDKEQLRSWLDRQIS